MKGQAANTKMLSGLMFRLLPIQVVLAAVGSVNGIVSSFFASNFVGVEAMSAIGLFGPLNMLIGAISTMILGGSVILCGEYLGQNRHDKMQTVFSLNLAATSLIALFFTAAFLFLGLFDLTGFLTRDAALRPIFNRYLLGQAIGVLPMMLASQLPPFLAMESKGKRTMQASLIDIAVNVVLTFLFVRVLHGGAFALALASSLSMWVFVAVEAEYFLSGKSRLRISFREILWREGGSVLRIGFPGAASYIYQTARGLIVNELIGAFVGSVGLSAFAASDNLLRIFWAVPGGMLAVSRLLTSVSIGEEDRQTLTDIMRVMFRRFIPFMCVICAAIIACAVPMTRIFFRDPTQPVYMMTVWGLRILPLCMPLSIICMHFTCYAQISEKHGLVHTLSLLDGVVCVAGFSALLIRSMGMNAIYVANVLNGVVTALVVIGYAWIQNRHLPRTMDELMVVPADFGAPESERMDLTVKSMEDVVTISRQVQQFCLDKGIDSRRAFLAGLAMEEMAGNIVDHGFTKDKKSHSVDVRVVHKGEDVILRLRDDCVPFDPAERERMGGDKDLTRNVGLRMVFRIARDIQYQYVVGLNVLTIRI